MTVQICATCKHYEFEDRDGKNYCTWYRDYYYPDDTCSHWEESEYVSGGSSGGCFLTTACCQHRGLPDDCDELQTLRAFRDNVMKPREDLGALVQEYYRVAPGIVESIDAREDRGTIWEDVYQRILKSVALVKAGKDDEAVESYRSMVAYCQSVVG